MKPWQRALLAVAAYLAAAVAFTWPLVLNLQTQVLGYLGFENTAQTLWLYHAWKEYQADLLQHYLGTYGTLGSLWRAEEIYRLSVAWPEKNSVANGLDFLWTLPLEALFGTPGYYNVKCLLVLTANGAAAMALARQAGARTLAAWTGGAVFAFNPFTFYLLATGRMVEAQLFLPVLAAWTLIRAWRDPDAFRWAVAGGALGLVTANYWFYGHFMIVFTLAWLAWHLVTKRPPTLGPGGRNLAFYVLAFLVVCLPAAHPYLVRLAIGERIPGMVRPDPGDEPNMIRQMKQLTSFSADADYPLRQPPRNVRSQTSPPWWIPLQSTFLANATVLAVLPALLLRRGGFWLAGALLFYLLPLGPFLKWGGDLAGNGISLPYLPLVLYFPLLEKLFWPNQSMLLFAMCVAVLLALNLERLLALPRLRGPLPAAVCAAVLGLMVLEMSSRGQLPLPATEWSVPQVYTGAGRGSGYVYLPVGRRYWETARDYNRDYYHGSDLTLVDMHHVMNGGKGLWGRAHYTAARDYWLYEPYNLSTQPFLRWLVALGDREPPPFEPRDQQQVMAEGYRYLVVLERLCVHVPDRGSYKVDLAEGARRFDALSATLRERFGAPVHDGTEVSWDQGIQPGGVTPHRFRVAIFDLGEEAQETLRKPQPRRSTP